MKSFYAKHWTRVCLTICQYWQWKRVTMNQPAKVLQMTELCENNKW